jgi:hypothetical protein
MKANDITKPSDKTLRESVDRNPVPGFKAEDLFELSKAIRDDEFDEGVDCDTFLREMDNRFNQYNNKL